MAEWQVCTYVGLVHKTKATSGFLFTRGRITAFFTVSLLWLVVLLWTACCVTQLKQNGQGNFFCKLQFIHQSSRIFFCETFPLYGLGPPTILYNILTRYILTILPSVSRGACADAAVAVENAWATIFTWAGWSGEEGGQCLKTEIHAYCYSNSVAC